MASPESNIIKTETNSQPEKTTPNWDRGILNGLTDGFKTTKETIENHPYVDMAAAGAIAVGLVALKSGKAISAIGALMGRTAEAEEAIIPKLVLTEKAAATRGVATAEANTVHPFPENAYTAHDGFISLGGHLSEADLAALRFRTGKELPEFKLFTTSESTAFHDSGEADLFYTPHELHGNTSGSPLARGIDWGSSAKPWTDEEWNAIKGLKWPIKVVPADTIPIKSGEQSLH